MSYVNCCVLFAFFKDFLLRLKFGEFGPITAVLRSVTKLCLRELKANGVCLKLVIQWDLHVVHEVSLDSG